MMYKAKRDKLQVGMKSGILLKLFKVVLDIKKKNTACTLKASTLTS